jgi:probable rRNA maturation factor
MKRRQPGRLQRSKEIPMNVQINDEVGQDTLSAEEIVRLVTYVLSEEGLPDDYEVSVSFVSVDEIHRLNREYRGIDRPTDVLSFNIDDPEDEDDVYLEVEDDLQGEDIPDGIADDEGEGDPDGNLEPEAEGDGDGALGDSDELDECGELDERMLGDVILCPEVILGQAPGFGNSAADEMRLLLVHGCLHLMGYDHETPDEAEEMEARERAYLAPFADAPAGDINVGPTVDHAAEGSAAK